MCFLRSPGLSGLIGLKGNRLSFLALMLLANGLNGEGFGVDLAFTGEVPVDLNFGEPALIIFKKNVMNTSINLNLVIVQS